MKRSSLARPENSFPVPTDLQLPWLQILIDSRALISFQLTDETRMTQCDTATVTMTTSDVQPYQPLTDSPYELINGKKVQTISSQIIIIHIFKQDRSY